MKYLILLIVLLLLPFSLANPSAQDIDLAKKLLIQQLPKLQENFNKDTTLPQPIKFLLNDEKINLNLGNTTLGLVFVDGKIDSLGSESFEEPDFIIYLSDSFLLDLSQEKPNFKQSLTNGDIVFEGNGLINSLKLSPINLFLKFI